MDYRHILEELREHNSARRIAELGLASRNTVKDIRERVAPLGWLDLAVPMPSPEDIKRVLVQEPPVPVVPSTVEPFREHVERWVGLGHTPTQIYSALKREPHKFKGSVGAVKRFVKRLQGNEPPAYVVLHFEPGEAAQVDFGTGPVLPHPVTRKPTKTHVFVMTLCYSRHMYAEVVWDQKVETWLRCHQNAFDFFGGVPAKCVIDNLKSAITKACHRDPVVQRSYAQLARDWKFQIEPCKPKHPWLKGRVERGVSFYKRAFLPLRTFRNIEDANQQLLEWVLEAGNRIHGTTQEVPLQVFAEREKAVMLPIPDPRPELVVWAKAKLHPNCHLTFERSYYSAPYRLVHDTLDLRVGERMVEVFKDAAMVAIHPRAVRPGTFRTNTEHYPPEKTALLQQTPRWCLWKAAAVGSNCADLIRRMLEDKGLSRLRGVQGILRLADKYGNARLEAACARALAFEALEWRAVKTILEKGLDQVPQRPDASGQLHLPLIMTPRFGRDISAMLTSN